jgi:hypothetical protein
MRTEVWFALRSGSLPAKRELKMAQDFLFRNWATNRIIQTGVS